MSFRIAYRFSEFSRVFQGTVGFDKILRVASAKTEFQQTFSIVADATQIIFAQFPVQ